MQSSDVTLLKDLRTPRVVGQGRVPPEMTTQCPMHQSVVLIAELCDKCPHFEGILVRNPDESAGKWYQRHAVRCNYPRHLAVLPLMTMKLANGGGE